MHGVWSVGKTLWVAVLGGFFVAGMGAGIWGFSEVVHCEPGSTIMPGGPLSDEWRANLFKSWVYFGCANSIALVGLFYWPQARRIIQRAQAL